ncbi:MAG: hypothetical protein IJI57_01570 [Flexilinea sp.]|nr:hypothetical protein [Flexilinea sp.]
MKKYIIFCVFAVMLTAAISVCAQGNGFVNPDYSAEYKAQQEQRLWSVEQTFPRILLWETYDGTEKPDTSSPAEGFYYYDANRAGKREIMLASAAPASIEKGYGEQFFNITGSYTEFYLSMDVQIIEQDESQSGYLWIQYTDGNLVGDEARTAAEIDFPYAIRKYETGPGGRVYTTFYDLSEYRGDESPHRIEMIRQNGLTSVFIDGGFIVEFADGLSGRFYTLYGSALRVGGRYVTGHFDNYIVRFNSY